MTATRLAIALIVGVLIGTLGHYVVVPRGQVPFWVSLGVATGAVLLGAIVARLAGIGVSGFGIAELLIQVVFGGCAVALVAGTADRQPADRRAERG